jgi:hypothetical protein
MNTSFTKKLLALITLSLFATVLSAINFKTDLSKTANNSSLAFWQQSHIPDYSTELQNVCLPKVPHDCQF